VTDTLHTGGDLARRLYNGNGQTYALHMLAFVSIVYWIYFVGIGI
jgi:hypothetical protein